MSSPASRGVSVDPDVDLHVAARRRQRAFDPAVLAVIALGGVAGAEARYALSRWLVPAPGSWPVATWWINIVGSFVLGALMVVLTELTSPHRLLRPFLGVGVLGGFTTFSTAMVDVRGLLADGHPALAMAYLFGTVLAALVAVTAGAIGMRALAAGWTAWRRRRKVAR